jgi:phosphotransferase system HPr-like phosphotransfer protein
MTTTEKLFKIKNGLQFDDGTSVTTAAGLQGATGPTGAQGSQGQTGATGLTGATGAAATTADITFSESTVSTVNTNQDLTIDPNGTGGLVVKGGTHFLGSSQGVGSQLVFKLSRGTTESPTAVQSGDALGGLAFSGYNGTEYIGVGGTSSVPTSPNIVAYATGNWSSTASPMGMLFRTFGVSGVAYTSTNRVTSLQLTPTANTYRADSHVFNDTVGPQASGRAINLTAGTGGSTSTSVRVEIIGNQNHNQFGPSINFRNYRYSGTQTTAALVGDPLGGITFNTQPGVQPITNPTAGTTINAQIFAFANENFSATNRGSRIDFNTTRNGTTSMNKVLELDGIGATFNAGVRERVVDLGSASGTLTLDVSSGTVFRLTAVGAITLNALTNVQAGSNATVIITQDGTGGRALTSTMKFAGGSKTLSTAANSIDMITVFYDGTNYFASLVKDYK